MTEIAKKLELSLAEKEHSRNELAEKLNSATFQQAENITAVIEVNFGNLIFFESHMIFR